MRTRILVCLAVVLMLGATSVSAHPQNDTWAFHGPNDDPIDAAQLRVNDISSSQGFGFDPVALATDEGLFVMQGGSDTSLFHDSTLGAISKVHADPASGIYVAFPAGNVRWSSGFGSGFNPPATTPAINAFTDGIGDDVYGAHNGGIAIFDGPGSPGALPTTGLTDTNVKDVLVANDYVWAATPSGVFRFGFEGTWSATEVTGSVVAFAKSHNKIFAGGPDGVYTTSDNSDWTEWNDVFGVTDLASHLGVGAGSTVYAATEAGVWRSNDAGATWASFNGDLPFAAVTSVNVIVAGPAGVGIGTEGSGFWDRIQDIFAFPPTFTKPNSNLMRQKAINVQWTNDDDEGGSGIAHSDISYVKAGPTGTFGTPVLWKNNTTATSATLTGAPGNTYCFSGNSTDNAGNVSYESSQACTNVPMNDTQLAVSGGPWTRFKSAGTYLGDASRATRKGAALIKNVTDAQTITVIATKCPTCGKVKVFFDSTLLGTIDLASSSTRKKQFLVAGPPPGGLATGVIKLQVATTGKPVIIEGLGVVRDTS